MVMVRPKSCCLLVLKDQVPHRRVAGGHVEEAVHHLGRGAGTGHVTHGAAGDEPHHQLDAFAAGLARYAETDLLCYRGDGPAPLIERQTAAWDPPLAWARQRYDAALHVIDGFLNGSDLVFETTDVLKRLDDHGDIFSPVLELEQELPEL